MRDLAEAHLERNLLEKTGFLNSHLTGAKANSLCLVDVHITEGLGVPERRYSSKPRE